MLERPPREVICCGIGWVSEVCEMEGVWEEGQEHSRSR